MAAAQQGTPPILAGFRHRYVMLALTIAAILAAIWFLDGGRLDQEVAKSTSITLTGIKGGVTPRVGEPAPDFTLTSIDGTSVTLSSLRSRPVLVNFWATWCPPCRAEMPDLQAVSREYRDQGLVVLGVNLQEERAPVVRYAQTLGLTFPLLLDPGGTVATLYNVTGLPTSYFVDREGTIRGMNIGPLTPKGLRAKVARILE